MVEEPHRDRACLAGAGGAGDRERVQPRYQEPERGAGRTRRSGGTAPRVRADPGGGGSNPRGAEAGTDGIARDTCREKEMSNDLLFEHFSTLATAPDGIARLRELILQLAVQGKLGTQDPGDEPASFLLKRIEKERFASEGKTKKEKSLDPVKDSDVSFQIPDTWVLTRLGNIAQYNAETKTSSNDISDNAWVFDLEDIEKDTSRILQKVRFKDRRSLSTKSRFRKGDILYGKLRPYLNKVVVADEDGFCTTEIVPIRPYGKIFPTFLMYALKTPDFLSYVNSKTYGIKMPRLGTADALNTIIALPPLAEQHRIVAKVDRLMALCDELEARQQQERAGCLKLGTASLAGLQNATYPEEFEWQWALVCDVFYLILDCPENVAVLRQTILQLAVQGRLVRQEPGDEPAEKLLRRIREENKKIILRNSERKFKIPDPVNVDEQSGDIPPGWWWSKLPEIIKPEKNSIKRGPFGSAIIKAYFVPKGYKIYEQKNAIYDDFSIGNYYINDLKFDELKDFEIKPNDIIISCAGTVGKLAIVPENIERGIINQALLKITLNNNVMTNEYFRMLFASFLMRTDTLSDLKGTAMKNIVSLDLLRKIVFPLPPLPEQHRIVAKVDALMALCDVLESRLKERATTQQKFANAVVKSIGTC